MCLLYKLLYKVTVNTAVFTSNVQCVCLAAGRRTLIMCCYRSRFVFNYCFEDTDTSQGSVVTHLRCDGIFRRSLLFGTTLCFKVSVKFAREII